MSDASDEACGRCGSRVLTGQGYGVYSGAIQGVAVDHRVFFSAPGPDAIEKDDIESKQLDAMLYCGKRPGITLGLNRTHEPFPTLPY